MFEEYMRNLLGFKPYRANIYENQLNFENEMYNQDQMGDFFSQNNNVMPYNTVQSDKLNNEIEEMYPEIYKIAYPMVQKACMKNTGNITKDLVDQMVDEICNNIESQENRINLNINLKNETNNCKMPINKRNINDNNIEEKIEYRQRNYLLNDLVRILLIRELLGKPGCQGLDCHTRPRPPMFGPGPGPGPRPPFPKYL